MSSNLESVVLEDNRRIVKALGLAILVFIAAGNGVLFLVHVRFHAQPAINLAPVLEAEIVDRHELAKLYETQPKTAPAKQQMTVTTNLSHATASSEQMNQLMEEQNQTVTGAPPVANHGPTVQSSLAPKLPDYLKNQNLKTSVLIEFFVSHSGVSTPSLIGSSGNEEVDALALKAAQHWIFGPAMRDGKPIDAKVRLRINFEVE